MIVEINNAIKAKSILEEVEEYYRLRSHPFSSEARSISSSSLANDSVVLHQQQALLMEKDRERKRKEYLEPSKPDDDWLPLKNPKPIDDEPWFTG